MHEQWIFVWYYLFKPWIFAPWYFLGRFLAESLLMYCHMWAISFECCQCCSSSWHRRPAAGSQLLNIQSALSVGFIHDSGFIFGLNAAVSIVSDQHNYETFPSACCFTSWSAGWMQRLNGLTPPCFWLTASPPHLAQNFWGLNWVLGTTLA